MSENVKLSNFEVGKHSVDEIGIVNGSCVVEDIKDAFEYKDSDLSGLIGLVAPYKDLQHNIEFAKEQLSNRHVQQRLGYDSVSAAQIAHDWGVRFGLQESVFRPIMEPLAEGNKPDFDVAVITEGVVNWMNRMGQIAINATKVSAVKKLLLVSNDRVIEGSENPDVEAGTPTNKFMATELLRVLSKSNKFESVELIHASKAVGETVMSRTVKHLGVSSSSDLNESKILVPTVAGNWAQKGSQLRQALQQVYPDFDSIEDDRQLWVVSDSFPLGITGLEPKTTHQNPLSAIGNILRSAKLLEDLGR